MGRRAERAGTVQPREGSGEALSRCVNTRWDNKDGARLLSAVPHRSTTGNGHKLKHRKFLVDKRLLSFSIKTAAKHWNRSMKRGWSFLLGDAGEQWCCDHGAEQPAPADPAWRAGYRTRGPFQPQLFCGLRTETM